MSTATIPDSDYYQLNRLARLRYRLRTDPRRVVDLAVLYVSVFVDWCGSTILAPLTPWLVESLAPEMDQGSAASLLMASYAAGTFMSCMLTGPISDRVGRRPVFLVAMLVHSVSYFALANAWDLPSFIVFRVIGGLSAGTRPVMIAYLADSSRTEDMPFYGVLMSFSTSLAMSIAPAFGGLLASHSLSLPFYVVGSCATAVFLAMAVFLREPSHAEALVSANEAANKTAAANRWLLPTVVVLSIGCFCSQYIYTSWVTVLGLLGADRYNLSTSQNGLVISSLSVATITSNLVYLPLAVHIPHALIAAFGSVLPVLVMVVPYIHNLVATILLGMSVQGGSSLFFAGLSYFTAVLSPAHRRGLVGSIGIGSANAGGIFGPLFGGILFDMDPDHRAYPFFVTTALAVMGGLACLVLHRGIVFSLALRNQKSSLRS